MLFALIVLRHGALWKATAYYENKHGQTEVTHSLHRERAEAVAALSWHFETWRTDAPGPLT